MDAFITTLSWYAAVSGMIAAGVIASDPGRKWMVLAFCLFLTSSLSWIVAGFLDSDQALAVQNIALSGVNAWGIYRWMRAPPGTKGAG